MKQTIVVLLVVFTLFTTSLTTGAELHLAILLDNISLPPAAYGEITITIALFGTTLSVDEIVSD